MPKRKLPASVSGPESREIIAELTPAHPRAKLVAELFAARKAGFLKFNEEHPEWAGDLRNMEELRHSVMALAAVIEVLETFEVSYIEPNDGDQP